MQPRSLALATDLYQLTMAAGYFAQRSEQLATFELFVRRLPKNRSFLIAAGLAQALEYLTELQFQADEIDYLRRLPVFRHVPGEFFDYLRSFRFTGEVWAMPEGTPFFPPEPILRVTAPIIQAQLLETYLLSTMNFQTMIASKAARIVGSAEGRGVVEFGSRRAHGMEAGLYAARAAFIGGCIGTSNVEAGYRFGIPVSGTMAHSWVMSFPTERAAFAAYVNLFPDTAVLLLDTYNTLQGARLATEFGPKLRGVRLDSGDFAGLSREVRQILDAAGQRETKILVSGDMNEEIIASLLAAGSPIDLFGVGTQLATSYDSPALGGVYKLVEQTVRETVQARMKLSEDKSTYPGRKQVWRTTGPRGKPLVDVISTIEERVADARPLLECVMREGKLVNPLPSLQEIQAYACHEISMIPANVRMLNDPVPYPVEYSAGLKELREQVQLELEAQNANRTSTG